MKRIEILISPTGESHLETKGFSGTDCREASQFLESALGRYRSERLTGDFFIQETQQQPLRERG